MADKLYVVDMWCTRVVRGQGLAVRIKHINRRAHNIINQGEILKCYIANISPTTPRRFYSGWEQSAVEGNSSDHDVIHATRHFTADIDGTGGTNDTTCEELVTKLKVKMIKGPKQKCTTHLQSECHATTRWSSFLQYPSQTWLRSHHLRTELKNFE